MSAFCNLHGARAKMAQVTAVGLLALMALPAVKAQGYAPVGGFVQLGAGQDDLASVTAGTYWAPFWRSAGGGLTGYAEAYASYWHAPAIGGGHKGFLQVAVVPMLRYRFDAGRSPWFVEGGIGLSIMTPRYVTANKTFGTNFNFSDNLAVGRSFGEGQKNELSLRVQHISNGGYKKPNPGEEFLQLRFARSF